jgi:hypothetical protein
MSVATGDATLGALKRAIAAAEKAGATDRSEVNYADTGESYITILLSPTPQFLADLVGSLLSGRWVEEAELELLKKKRVTLRDLLAAISQAL